MNAKQKQAVRSKIRAILKTKTQAWLAEKLGFTQAYVSQIVNEKTGLSEEFAARLRQLKG